MEEAETSGESVATGAARRSAKTGNGVVNINTADLAQLQKLRGVGPSTAQKFIEYRTQIGHFASVEQVQDIKGIGPKKFAKLYCDVKKHFSVRISRGADTHGV